MAKTVRLVCDTMCDADIPLPVAVLSLSQAAAKELLEVRQALRGLPFAGKTRYIVVYEYSVSYVDGFYVEDGERADDDWARVTNRPRFQRGDDAQCGTRAAMCDEHGVRWSCVLENDGVEVLTCELGWDVIEDVAAGRTDSVQRLDGVRLRRATGRVEY